jgi:hypothetical protein
MADLDDIPTQEEFSQWRNKIFAMETGAGQPAWNVGQLNQAVGALVNGRTWRQINDEMRAFLEIAPPAQQPSVTRGLRAETIAGTPFVGFVSGTGGRMIPTERVYDMDVARLVSAAAVGGTVALDILLNSVPLPQDAFSKLRIASWELLTADAQYLPDHQTWAWSNTGFVLVPGQTYEVEVFR